VAGAGQPGRGTAGSCLPVCLELCQEAASQPISHWLLGAPPQGASEPPRSSCYLPPTHAIGWRPAAPALGAGGQLKGSKPICGNQQLEMSIISLKQQLEMSVISLRQAKRRGCMVGRVSEGKSTTTSLKNSQTVCASTGTFQAEEHETQNNAFIITSSLLLAAHFAICDCCP